MREGIVREFGMVRYTLLCLERVTNTLLCSERVTNEDLVYSTGNSAQCCMAARMGGEAGGKWVSIVCLWLSPFVGHWKLSQHC